MVESSDCDSKLMMMTIQNSTGLEDGRSKGCQRPPSPDVVTTRTMGYAVLGDNKTVKILQAEVSHGIKCNGKSGKTVEPSTSEEPLQ